MPIGAYMAVPHLATTLIAHRPARVLDLGLGFGMNGVAVRQWLDLGVLPRSTFLAGVEVWPNNRSPLWDVYDVIYLQSIEEYLFNTTDKFGMIILGDVIEHFEKEAGQAILGQVEQRLTPGGIVFVSTPDGDMPQGAAHGNPYESHRSGWREVDFAVRGYRILLSSKDPQLPPAWPTLVAVFQR